MTKSPFARRVGVAAPAHEADPPTPGARLVTLEDGRTAEVVDEHRSGPNGYRPGMVILFCEPLSGAARHPRWLPENRVEEVAP